MLNFLGDLFSDIGIYLRIKIEKYIKIPLKNIFGEILGEFLSFIFTIVIVVGIISIPIIAIILLGTK